MTRTNASLAALASAVFLTTASAAPCDPQWDTTLGSPGIVEHAVLSLAIYEGELLAGCQGSGATADDPLHLVRRWTGSEWAPFGPAFFGTMRSDIASMLVFEGDLYIFGIFSVPGHQASNAARWDGHAWQPLAGGPDGRVYNAIVHDGRIIAAGYFSQSSGNTNTRVKAWDGAAWTDLGDRFSDSPVTMLFSHQGELLTGVNFYDGSFVGSIAAWNGESWVRSQYAAIAPAPVSLRVIEGQLHALSARATPDVAQSWPVLHRFENGAWQTVATATARPRSAPLSPLARASTLDRYADALVLGGHFASVDGVAARDIASGDGKSWSPLADSINSSIAATLPLGNALIVAGGFTSINGQTAWSVAALVGCEGACPADANADSFVDFADLSIVLSRYGRAGAFLPGDTNSDGVIDFNDLIRVLTDFGAACP